MLYKSLKKTGHLLMALFLFSLNLYSDNESIKNGVLDLRNRDFEKDGIYHLSGQYEFYYNGFILSKDFDTLSKKHYLKVPGTWQGQFWYGVKMKDTAYGTYHLRILVNQKCRNLAFKLPNQSAAYKFYVNDSLVFQNGSIGKSRHEEIPQSLQSVYNFTNQSDTIDIVYQVSNFHYRKGGLWKTPSIGTDSEIQHYKNIKIANDYWLAGILFLFTFTILIFYFYRRKERISLFFGFFGLIGLFRVMATGEVFVTAIFPNFNWEIMVKFELIPFFLAPAIITLIVFTLFRKENVKWIAYAIVFISALFCLFVLFTPAIISSYLVSPYYYFYLLCLPYFLYVFTISIVRKREGALLLLIGFISALSGMVFEVLYYSYVVNFYIPGFFGVCILLFAQVILLASRFSSSFTRIENFASELEETVKIRTFDLRNERDKNEQLLLNTLPVKVVQDLKEFGKTEPEKFENVTVYFSDVVGFTNLSTGLDPALLISELNEIFTAFDDIMQKYDCERIKTIGDAYMAVCGMPQKDEQHAVKMLNASIQIIKYLEERNKKTKLQWRIRIGINTGRVVGGVVGVKKYIYDVFGDTINTASRMESNSEPMRINVSEATYQITKDKFKYTVRKPAEIKGKGLMQMYFLEIE